MTNVTPMCDVRVIAWEAMTEAARDVAWQPFRAHGLHVSSLPIPCVRCHVDAGMACRNPAMQPQVVLGPIASRTPLSPNACAFLRFAADVAARQQYDVPVTNLVSTSLVQALRALHACRLPPLTNRDRNELQSRLDTIVNKSMTASNIIAWLRYES